jgi:hypothetical protein
MDKQQIIDHTRAVLEHANKIMAEITADEPNDDIIFGQAFHIEMNGKQIKRLAQELYVNPNSLLA